MLKRDFIAKYIEELGKMLGKLLDIEQYQEAVSQFDFYFDEMLHTYYKINSEQLAILLEENEERDLFLLAFDLKNKNILAFAKAAKYFYSKNQVEKVATIKKIIQRIQEVKSDVFQFPTAEDQAVAQVLMELERL
ncbi:hypothetical protein [Vaginella massiliensis]|uniref:hypothetical protein n=1 Tax=Vaginella massiliensis TaxID=1816680 RepID=UPI000838A2C9|nr:hypothetical protein [Vaginella massiliensis]